MAIIKSRRSHVAVSIGLIAGYAIWMASMLLIISFTPVGDWATAAVLALVCVTTAAFATAPRQNDHDKAFACWLAPALPAVASGYLLIGPFFLAIGSNISA